MMATVAHDFSTERGISAETCALYNVRVNGTGWLWDTKRLNGEVATRWKSFYSTREAAPEDEQERWKKYIWYPDKPDDAKYFYPPKLSLKQAILDCDGTLWLVGGEVAAMSMLDGGFPNTISFFGDSSIPDSLASDLEFWNVKRLCMIPDRDTSGQTCAENVKKALSNTLIDFQVFALPYPLEEKHGKDVNDYWRMCNRDKKRFQGGIDLLTPWSITVRETPVALSLGATESLEELPARFVSDIESHLNIYPQYNEDGFSRRNICCPFHTEEHPSATWNHDKAFLKCFGACGRTYNAKEVGEKIGLLLRDYYEDTLPSAPPVAVSTPPAVSVVPLPILRPALPSTVELTAAQKVEAKAARTWLDECVAWATASCPLAPDIFHEAMALWLLASVSTRRMKLTIGGEDIYPNLYIMIVAKTTLYHKSTALNRFRKLIKEARLESLLLPIDVTPEALFDELAGIKPANFDSLPQDEQHNWLLGRAVAGQRTIIKDEASSILASLKKEYNAGLSELLLQGYDGDAGTLRKLLKSRGIIVVKDMCLSFLGATTPVMYSKYMGNEEAENGFIARFAIITPEGIPTYRDPAEDIGIPPSLVQGLRRMFADTLPWHNGQKPSAPQVLGDVVSPPVTSVAISPEAFQQLNRYRKALGYDMLMNETVDDSKSASYGRLGTMAYKVAMLLAAVQATPGRTIRIEACHAYAAQLICERWRESLHRLDRDIARTGNTMEDKVLAYLKTAGETGVTMRDLLRDCGIKEGKAKALTVLNTLADEGLVEKMDVKPEGRGRPSIRYRYVKADINEGISVKKDL